ncbi:hypothetical protein CAOG_00551 [Capsaspora owczarzaki ATCC 30864]|uniref:Ribosome maturation protein SDO1/SBDS N-terminal domain-containing protein n=1 Tax=Capsaspora owczarzaki (strain ATCC 30864) TaxID=595528 RepID=A0A0D2VGI5_CAPO3|nr:hypothetical protein CAOG_00551 [Capsaspora owczarzaki ATCC 30864]KJE88987.1 hypothetical protein CAOG_000551 [Capsaspora owczarzaki ATCC 30864]|eukprot:XP_004365422.1 hypothetical protein CAOG_00551 [Capsaspora owczarzaki ATCC 30864]
MSAPRVAFQSHEKTGKDNYFVFVESSDAVNKWRKDKSVALVDVVMKHSVFVHRGDVKGEASTPTKADLETVFGSSNETAAIEFILTNGKFEGGHESKHASGFYSR